MFTVMKRLDFCYGHRLLNYQGKCRNLHGHNATAEIILATSQLDELGMVRDFVEIKEKLGAWIDAELDHRLLLQYNDPLIPLLRQQQEPIVVMNEIPTAENIARLIFTQGRELQLPLVEVRLWETPRAYASWRPGDES